MWCIENNITAIDYDTGERRGIEELLMRNVDILGLVYAIVRPTTDSNMILDSRWTVGGLAHIAVPFTKYDYEFHKLVTGIRDVRNLGQDMGYEYCGNGVVGIYSDEDLDTPAFMSLLGWAKLYGIPINNEVRLPKNTRGVVKIVFDPLARKFLTKAVALRR